MNHRRGLDRHQTLLLPERLEDYIADDNPVRFVDAFVVTRRIFRDELKLGPPSLLAALVAGLAFLGLTGRGEDPLAALLIPYEALAVTVLILFLLFWIPRLVKPRPNPGQPPENGFRRDSKSIRKEPADVDCRAKKTAPLFATKLRAKVPYHAAQLPRTKPDYPG